MSLEQFKELIKPVQEKPPNYYYNGERRAQMLYTKLRPEPKSIYQKPGAKPRVQMWRYSRDSRDSILLST